MSMTSTDLCSTVEEHLLILGYKIFDEPDEGCEWQLGDFCSRSVSLAFDNRQEAVADAVRDLALRSQELLAAARVVVDRWSQGDLAEAVRELDLCVQGLATPTAESASDGADALQAWLVHGDGPNGPWREEAFVDFDAAVTRAIAVGQQWIDEGHVVDLAHLEAELRKAHFSWVLGLDASIHLVQIDVVGGR